jgi:hypothetical protein
VSRGGSTGSNPGASATDYYYVCKVQDPAGAVTFQAIPITELKTRQKKLNESFIEAAKEWKAARDASGTAATEPPPKRPRILVGQRVRGRATAENMAALLQEKWDSLRRKAEDKGDKPTADPKASGAGT